MELQTDIRQIDFSALRNAGYKGAVFDKDNCLVSNQNFTFDMFLEYVADDSV
jgi:predicted HAD superfamily phosphohydrolase YqeG